MHTPSITRSPVVWIALLAGLALALGGLGCLNTFSTRGTPSGVGTATIWIHNGTPDRVYFIHIRPSGQSDWGGNQLGSGGYMEPGQTFQMFNIPPGEWDISVDSGTGDVERWLAERLDSCGVYDAYFE